MASSSSVNLYPTNYSRAWLAIPVVAAASFLTPYEPIRIIATAILCGSAQKTLINLSVNHKAQQSSITIQKNSELSPKQNAVIYGILHGSLIGSFCGIITAFTARFPVGLERLLFSIPPGISVNFHALSALGLAPYMVATTVASLFITYIVYKYSERQIDAYFQNPDPLNPHATYIEEHKAQVVDQGENPENPEIKNIIAFGTKQATLEGINASIFPGCSSLLAISLIALRGISIGL